MIDAPAIHTAGGHAVRMRAGSRPASRRILVAAASGAAAGMALNAVWQTSMPPTGDIPMPGGWALSSVWMPMCGQSWPDSALHFLAMWMAMMAAMMLPALAPALWRYRRALGKAGARHAGFLCLIVGIGYFSVWALPGAAVYPLGAAFAGSVVRRPALAECVPMAAGVIASIAGALQFTAWKTGHLRACNHVSNTNRPTSGDALRQGLHLGYHCLCSCSGFTAALLATGVMDLLPMTVATAAIACERIASDDNRMARAIGICLMAMGVFSSIRAASFG